ncbi:PadR family transcriptional regulator [Allorhizocola rhizosphaerae]|uniref:PadR family transcriptional regulator n=1 Tax=Allorhizocola rhizosphaerae TaxID=1872709 RepID=UPI000E3E5672|nr:PadR family transcriptional regulator [Allorhizocola rhizosphaerae]
MTRSFSPQTVAVLRLLAEDPSAWVHGYDIARRIGLKSGTLYPILMRLAERGLLEARWEDAEQPGRPRRHAYRLTDGGARQVAAIPAEQTKTARRMAMGEA